LAKVGDLGVRQPAANCPASRPPAPLVLLLVLRLVALLLLVLVLGPLVGVEVKKVRHVNAAPVVVARRHVEAGAIGGFYVALNMQRARTVGPAAVAGRPVRGVGVRGIARAGAAGAADADAARDRPRAPPAVAAALLLLLLAVRRRPLLLLARAGHLEPQAPRHEVRLGGREARQVQGVRRQGQLGRLAAHGGGGQQRKGGVGRGGRRLRRRRRQRRAGGGGGGARGVRDARGLGRAARRKLGVQVRRPQAAARADHVAKRR